MYTINTIDDWSCSGKPADMKISETDSTLDAFVLRTYTHRKHPLHRRIAATISALGLILTLGGAMGCDKHDGGQDDAGVDACAAYCDSGSSEGGSGEGGSNHPPNPIDDDSVTPANNTSYTVGDVIPAGFTAPSDPDGDSLEGKIVLSAPSQSFIKEYPSSTLTPGQHYGLDINTSTANAGGPLPASVTGTEYEVILSATDGKGGESKATRKVTLKALDPNKPRITGCYVTKSNVGAGFSADCFAVDPNDSSGMSLVGNWHLLTTDLSGAMILDKAAGVASVVTARVMEASDVGLHNFSVTASNVTYTSDSEDFSVSADEHDCYISLHCNSGSNNRLLLPETSVDTVSTACFSGYNPSLKPNQTGQPSYIGDVAPTCAKTALDSLSTAEKDGIKHYNGGQTGEKTPWTVFSSCTVDFAQVEYHSDKP
jgi:hypothetical protein